MHTYSHANSMLLLVMGRALGLARARPGLVHFWRARARFFGKGPGLGSARARCQSPGACEGLFRMKKVYSFDIKNIKIWIFGE